MAGTGTAHLRPLDDHAVLRAEDVVVEFPVGRTGLVVSAVAGVSLDVVRGETVGVVGESGCGKTSLARAVMQLPPPSAGSVWFEGRLLTGLDRRSMRAARTGMQMVFQDPVAALNPPSDDARGRPPAVVHLESWRRRRAVVRCRSAPRRGRHRPNTGRREPATPVLRRAVSAGRHRQSIGPRSEPGDLRRAGVRARRQRAGPSPQPARGPQVPPRPVAALHRP